MCTRIFQTKSAHAENHQAPTTTRTFRRRLKLQAESNGHKEIRHLTLPVFTVLLETLIATPEHLTNLARLPTTMLPLAAFVPFLYAALPAAAATLGYVAYRRSSERQPPPTAANGASSHSQSSPYNTRSRSYASVVAGSNNHAQTVGAVRELSSQQWKSCFYHRCARYRAACNASCSCPPMAPYNLRYFPLTQVVLDKVGRMVWGVCRWLTAPLWMTGGKGKGSNKKGGDKGKERGKVAYYEVGKVWKGKW